MSISRVSLGKKLVQLKSTLGAARRYDEKGGSGGSNLDLEVGTTSITDQEFAKKNSFTKDKISLHVPDFQLVFRKVAVNKKLTTSLSQNTSLRCFQMNALNPNLASLHPP